MNKVMEKALNDHLGREFTASYLYLSMSAWSDSENMPGFANWFMIQHKEEKDHVDKFFAYMNERGYQVKLGGIEAQKTEWKNALEAFEDTIEHEKMVTACINELVDLSLQQKDHATNNFLQWFVAEQVEEEASVNHILGQLKMIDGNGQGMYMMDNELSARAYVAPAN